MPSFRFHAASKAAVIFTSGPSHGEAIGTYQGEPSYQGSLDEAEYPLPINEMDLRSRLPSSRTPPAAVIRSGLHNSAKSAGGFKPISSRRDSRRLVASLAPPICLNPRPSLE